MNPLSWMLGTLALVSIGAAGVQSWRLHDAEKDRDAYKAERDTARTERDTCKADLRETTDRSRPVIERIEREVIQGAGDNWMKGYRDGLAACMSDPAAPADAPDPVRDCSVWLLDPPGDGARAGSAQDRLHAADGSRAAGQARSEAGADIGGGEGGLPEH